MFSQSVLGGFMKKNLRRKKTNLLLISLILVCAFTFMASESLADNKDASSAGISLTESAAQSSEELVSVTPFAVGDLSGTYGDCDWAYIAATETLTLSPQGGKDGSFPASTHAFRAATPWQSFAAGSKNITKFEITGKVKATANMSQFFYGVGAANGTEIVGFENIDTSDVTNMSQLFRLMTTRGNINFSNTDTSRVTDMSGMFDYYESKTGTPLNFEHFDTSNVENMSYMFGSFGNKTVDISPFEFDSVTNMTRMFSGQIIENINFGTSSPNNLQTAEQMFYYAVKLKSVDLSNWRVPKLANINEMFRNCREIESIDVSNWGAFPITNPSFVFTECFEVEEINLSGWEVTLDAYDAMFGFDENMPTLDLSGFTIKHSPGNPPGLYRTKLFALTLGENYYFNYPSEGDGLYDPVWNPFNVPGYTDAWRYESDMSSYYANGADLAYAYNANPKAGTYYRLGVPYTIRLEPEFDSLAPSDINTRYNDPAVTLTNPFVRKGYTFLGWNTQANGLGISYQAGDEVSDLTMTADDVIELYAQWEPSPFVVTFHAEGAPAGNFTNIVRYLSPVAEPSVPVYEGYLFDGWYSDQNTTVLWDFSTQTMPPNDLELYAKWISIAKLIQIKNQNVVVYKNESSTEEVEKKVDATAGYTDYLGVPHTFPVILEWNPIWLTEGGVNEIKPYVIDPSTGQKVYGTRLSDLYVLNRPYITGTNEIWIFVGEWVNPDNLFVTGYGETPNFTEKRIDRTVLDLNFDSSAVDVNTAGTYWASFSAQFHDYDSKFSTVSFPITVHVRNRQGLTREEQLQVDSSVFWLKVTEIYHLMQPGQIIDVNSNNYTDGGNLRTEKVEDRVGYDKLINVDVGKFIYMSPNILNTLQEEETGRLNVNLEGRSWIFTSSTTETLENNYPKGYYNLRMDVGKKEEITNLAGEENPQMQLNFPMNRPWFGTPTFVISPNDSVKESLGTGTTPYLFHYNENTNELELVGAMKVEVNGNLSIPMNGIYKDYVILTSLPESGNYRITDQTNALDNQIYSTVAENLIDSGHVLPSGSGLNGISTTKYALITTDDAFIDQPSSSSNIIKTISLVAGGIGLLGVSFVYYKKRKKLED